MTGTNGKTTTAFLVRALLEAAGRQTGLLGTVKSVIGGVEHDVQRTTPEAIDLQRTFRRMLEAGDRACVMEVSSHALELRRADAIHFAAAIFTNLTQDHLDFHPTMEDYFQAKRRLFCGRERPGASVINVDDPYGARLAGELDGPITFALRADADYRATDVRTDLTGSSFSVQTPGRGAGAALAAAGPVQRLQRARRAGHGPGARGRRCPRAWRRSRPPDRCPAALRPSTRASRSRCSSTTPTRPIRWRTCCTAARGLTDARLHVVFGCGGDRDRGKRPLMGEIARRLADRVIVTSDNPRSEDPEAIIAEILAGSGPDVIHDADRHAAIATRDRRGRRPATWS